MATTGKRSPPWHLLDTRVTSAGRADGWTVWRESGLAKISVHAAFREETLPWRKSGCLPPWRAAGLLFIGTRTLPSFHAAPPTIQTRRLELGFAMSYRAISCAAPQDGRAPSLSSPMPGLDDQAVGSESGSFLRAQSSEEGIPQCPLRFLQSERSRLPATGRAVRTRFPFASIL